MARLIDADALDIEGFREDFPLCECDTGWNAAVRMINDYVKAAPTVEAEPVKRGEWRIAERDMSTHTVLVECSECYALLEIPMTAFGLNYDYCPNCGARMDGE